MSDLFANPLEEMIEFQDLKTDLQRGQGPLLVTGCLDSQTVSYTHLDVYKRQR